MPCSGSREQQRLVLRLHAAAWRCVLEANHIACLMRSTDVMHASAVCAAHVLSVEPHTDFAVALRDTADLNCWADRSTVINARVCTSNERQCLRTVVNASNCHWGGWRFGGRSQLTREYGQRCATLTGLPNTIGSVLLRDVLLQAARLGHASKATTATAELTLLKIDVDGPEGAWLREIDHLLTQRVLSIRTIIIEASFVKPSLMARFQNAHGFTCYRLDAHDSRRALTREGWDALSPPGTIAKLDRFGAEHREADTFKSRFSPHNERTTGSTHPTPVADGVPRVELEEELFSIRSMRHVYRARPRLSLQHWTTLMQPLQHTGYESAPLQWVLTRDGNDGDLTEPTLPYSDWRAVSPEYKHAHEEGYLPKHLLDAYQALSDDAKR